MTKLLINKKKALALLNDKEIQGKALLGKLDNVRSQADYDYLLDEHDIWWNSVGELLKQVFDNDSISKNFLFVGFFVPQVRTFSQEVSDFSDEIKSDLSKIQQIINDIKRDVYQQIDKFEFTYDGLIAYFKKNKIIAIIMIIILVFIGFSNVLDNYVKTNANLKRIQIENDSINKVKADITKVK